MSFLDNNESNIDNGNDIYDVEESEKNLSDDEVKLNTKKSVSKAEHDHEVRKRIDDLLEKRRLKELLDDSDDW